MGYKTLKYWAARSEANLRRAIMAEEENRKLRAILGVDYDNDRLRELVEADQDGRCVILPCKIGAKVYALEDRSYWQDVSCPYEHECETCATDCRYYHQEMVEKTEIAVRVVVSTGEMESVIRNLGKTVFLTREEAEAALREEEKK